MDKRLILPVTNKDLNPGKKIYLTNDCIGMGA
jgi:hypothetical protein